MLPFDLIAASDFTFDLDPFDTSSAIFHVATTEPTICSITWGPTPQLGNLNNSLTMDGTGIIQHDVPLPGAEPGATYHFTVQGSTADGRVFQSEPQTFTVPEPDGDQAAATTIPLAENLALAATVTAVSSEFSGSWAAENAIDGDMSTEWATAGDGSAGYLEVDLGGVFDIAGFEFVTRSMTDGSAITTEFTATVDGTVFGPFPTGTPVSSGFVAVDGARGQVVRFTISDSSGGNTGAIEIRVLAP